MKLISQPLNSKLCGHCCIAMITNTPLFKVIQLVGHSKGTYGKELIKTIQLLGIVCTDKLKFPISKPIPFAILRIKWGPTSGGGHWVVHKDGFIYDPSFKTRIALRLYTQKVLPEKARFISQLKIL